MVHRSNVLKRWLKPVKNGCTKHFNPAYKQLVAHKNNQPNKNSINN